MNKNKMVEDLLSWYDLNAREMPWRIPPNESKTGTRPNPYHIWMSPREHWLSALVSIQFR